MILLTLADSLKALKFWHRVFSGEGLGYVIFICDLG